MYLHWIQARLAHQLLDVQAGQWQGESQVQGHPNYQQALRHHPDKGGDVEEAFKAIQHAYDILSDPDKRREYDSGEHADDNDDWEYALVM